MPVNRRHNKPCDENSENLPSCKALIIVSYEELNVDSQNSVEYSSNSLRDIPSRIPRFRGGTIRPRINI